MESIREVTTDRPPVFETERVAMRRDIVISGVVDIAVLNFEVQNSWVHGSLGPVEIHSLSISVITPVSTGTCIWA